MEIDTPKDGYFGDKKPMPNGISRREAAGNQPAIQPSMREKQDAYNGWQGQVYVDDSSTPTPPSTDESDDSSTLNDSFWKTLRHRRGRQRRRREAEKRYVDSKSGIRLRFNLENERVVKVTSVQRPARRLRLTWKNRAAEYAAQGLVPPPLSRGSEGSTRDVGQALTKTQVLANFLANRLRISPVINPPHPPRRDFSAGRLVVIASMNILEEQMTDLTHLADTPLDSVHRADKLRTSLNMPSPSTSGLDDASHHDTPTMANVTLPPVSAMKRKPDDAQTPSQTPTGHTRAKRNRYIAIACNECKRRKIKCNGNTPCQRCGNLNLECLYAPNCCAGANFKDSDEFRRMNAQIAQLQDKVDTLYANVNALRAGVGPMHGEPSPAYTRDHSTSRSIQSQSPSALSHHSRTLPKPLRFQGPTSAAFGLDVAKNTLHSMGYASHVAEPVDDGPNDDASVGSPNPPSSASANHPQVPGMPNGPHSDPIFLLSRDEAIRLCRVYEDEMGMMYPVVNIDSLITHAKNLFSFVEAAYRHGLGQTMVGSHHGGLKDEKTNLLKMVIACAMTVEGSGRSDIGGRLFANVRGAVQDIIHAEKASLKQLPLLAIVEAMYHFHCDEEVLAWRLIGAAARMCLEAGLHRSDSLFKTITDEDERASAVKMFWSIYVLDRRWSFGSGLPFAIQDADVDPNLPEPGTEAPAPYLKIMIAYSRLGAKVWRHVNRFDHLTNGIKSEEVGYLDYQILQWQQSIPSDLRLPPPNTPRTSSRATHRLQVLLYLRCNQMRILIHRPVLHSAVTISDNPRHATTVVELAKDTIRVLSHLNQTTDIYRVQQVCFNYFLVSALTVIFLAVCHAAFQFSTSCREEFYQALDLVKGFSSRSFVSKRLWRTLKSVKEVAPNLGLARNDAAGGSSSASSAAGATGLDDEDPHSSAALAMAGLAGHDISSLPPGFVGDPLNNSPVTGFQISNEMTNLFEAALHSTGALGTDATGASMNGFGGMPSSAAEAGMSLQAGMFGSDEELYHQLKELF